MLSFWGHPKPRVRLALIAAVTSALVLTGCGGGEKVPPRVAVRDAVKATAAQKEGTYTFTIVGSEGDLNAVLNEGQPLNEEDRKGIDLLRNGHIAVSAAAEKFGLDIKAGDLEHAFELRYVDKKLYARADVAGLAKLFGASPEEIDQTVQGIASQEGFEFLAAAASGKWLVADFSALKSVFEGLAKQFGLDTGGSTGETGGSTATSGPGGGQLQAMKDALGKAFSESVTTQELKSDSVGDHYLATAASMRALYAKVRPIFEQYAGTYGKDLPPAEAVPDKPGSLDVWVKGDRVSRVELDLAQFSPAPPAGAGRVALRVDISGEAPALAAPPDAVPVDIAGLLGKFFSQFGQMLEGIGGGLSHYD